MKNLALSLILMTLVGCYDGKEDVFKFYVDTDQGLVQWDAYRCDDTNWRLKTIDGFEVYYANHQVKCNLGLKSLRPAEALLYDEPFVWGF